jgi:hypothetical protein
MHRICLVAAAVLGFGAVVAATDDARRAAGDHTFQGLWQNVAEITEHNRQTQHTLMLALARGEMPYGQFVQEDTLIGIRTAAAIRPLLRKLE